MKTEYQWLQVKITDGVAVIVFNNPPVNQLSENMMLEFTDAFQEAGAAEDIKAIVITGTGKNFVAGADITQLVQVTDKDRFLPLLLKNHEFHNAMEMSPKPLIAAINGNCLGGGLELAMACHYRIASGGVDLGLPEVTLGLLPGAGGTQRLPRLIGLPKAMDMITTGNAIKAENAHAFGLVDELAPADKLLEAALAAAAKFVSGRMSTTHRLASRRYDRLPSAMEKRALVNFSKAVMADKAKGYIAPWKILECFDKGLTLNYQHDIELEADLFADCLVSDVAKNLISIFLNERAAGRLPRIKDIKPARPRKVAMLGGGVMGCGIVHLLLANGLDAVLWDINDEALLKGVASAQKTFAYMLKKKKLTQDALEDLFTNKLHTSTNLEELDDVDMVIEAVPENMRIKQNIWKKLDRICREDVVFGTNTSALPITEMAGVLKDPGRMIGLHFFNPAERMPLLEVICTGQTSDKTLATSVAFARAIKKVPVVINDGPGFYVSRQLSGLMGGAVFLLAEGVDGAAIDSAMLEFGMPMGPSVLADLTGIDINYHVNRTFEKRLGERYAIHPLNKIIYQLGDYGRKSGKGYLDYTEDPPVPNPRVTEAIAKYLQANGVRPRETGQDEIVDLMLACGINEAAYMIQEGICDRPADMDLAMVYGTGFPPYRGGILRYADKWGLANVVKKLKELEAKFGPHFKPAPLLADMAAEGKTFYRQ